VMAGEKAPDAVPDAGVMLVVEIDLVGRSFAVAFQQHIRQDLAAHGNDGERGGFQRLDEAGGITDAYDVLDPAALVATAHKLDEAGGADLGVLAAEFALRLFLGDEIGAVDISAVDPGGMFNLPAPAAVHGFGSRVRMDWLVGAVPATDNRAIAKEAGLEAD